MHTAAPVAAWVEIEIAIGLAVGAFFAALTALVMGRGMMHMADCIVAGFAFRRRGFRNHDLVEVEGHKAVISSIGHISTTFRFDENGAGDGYDRYRTVSNARLGWLNIAALVPHHRGKGKST